MFSNQYMGTRQSSRNFSRSVFTKEQIRPYSKHNTQTLHERPVNARDPSEEDDEPVDYSFMKLPVSERRKLFLGGGQPDMNIQSYDKTFTLPRSKNMYGYSSNRHETQSEYGGEKYHRWESGITPTWTRENRSMINYPNDKLRTSQIIHPVRRIVNQHSPLTYSSGHYSPQTQYSTTIRVNDSYAPNQPKNVCIISGSGNRNYPIKHTSSSTKTFAPMQTYPSYNNQWNSYTHGQSAQPLRVNVYNSDSGSVILSPNRPREPTYNFCNTSPIYPAYPAHLNRNEYISLQPMRYRREQSAQPVAMYTSNNTYNSPRQNWQSIQVPQPYTHYSTLKPVSARLQVNPEIFEGVSDF